VAAWTLPHPAHYIAALADSASTFEQFAGMIAPKRGRVSEIPHPHAAHLPYLQFT